MNDNDLVDIIVKYALCDIVNTIEVCVGDLDEARVKATKEKLEPAFKSIYTNSIQKDKRFLLFLLNNNSPDNLRKKIEENIQFNYREELNSEAAILYFYAYYNNNVPLLETLLDNNFRFDIEGSNSSNIFVLNESLSSKFKIEKYPNIVKNKIDELRIANTYNKEKEIAILLNINPKFKIHAHVREFVEHILTKQCIKLFGYRYIAKTNETQQKMLLDAADNGTLKEIREIIRINPCFQAISRSAVKPDFINNFGIEKIAFLTDIQQFTYIAAFVNNKTAVLKKILTINPDFVTYVADNYSSVNIFDNKFINICKIENIAWFTPEEQRTLCSQYRRYEHYSSFNIELLGNQYRQLKGNVTKTKKLVKDRKKQLSIPDKV